MRIALLISAALATPAIAQETTFPATLTGPAFLPALSLIAPCRRAARRLGVGQVQHRLPPDGPDVGYG
jgi:hypothetical protein